MVSPLLLYSYGCEVGNKSEYLAAYEKTPQQFMDNPIIHWEAIWWIERPTALWVIEVFFALISLIEALLVAYLSFKVCLTNNRHINISLNLTYLRKIFHY